MKAGNDAADETDDEIPRGDDLMIDEGRRTDEGLFCRAIADLLGDAGDRGGGHGDDCCNKANQEHENNEQRHRSGSNAEGLEGTEEPALKGTRGARKKCTAQSVPTPTRREKPPFPNR